MIGEYESIVATLEVMSNPDLQGQIAAYEMARARGALDLIPHDEVVRGLRDDGA